jgi:hypothetical protein
MKKVLLAVVGILFAATSFAQNALVASLSHGTDAPKYYYGVAALKQAVGAATSGDIISLSGGIFEVTNIEMAITLRGAGFDCDNPTILNGNFSIDIPSTDTKQFTMEGIKCQNEVTLKGTFSNPYFVRSYIQKILGFEESDAVTNIMIINCKVPDGISVRGNSSLYLVNSYTGINERKENASVTAINCVLSTYAGNGRFDNAQLYNCILSAPYGSPEAGLSETCLAVNCVSTRLGGRYYTNIFHGGCINCLYDIQGIVKDTETFELTDEAKTTYLGTDGTQVGLYGGLQPYNSKPSYPLITKMDVGEKTNADGELEVAIEVK